MMAAITAAANGHQVTLMEKNDRLGKKLAITGGGRCNLSNATDPEGLIQNVKTNPSFLYSAFYTFGSSDLVEFFENRGLPLKVENGRIFPKSDRAADVVAVLEETLKKSDVKILLNHTVKDIKFLLKNSAVIVATGGVSYPSTGSTGDGYRWAKELGHKIVEPRPALVPLLADVQGLAGLSLKNVGLKLNSYYGQGELLFTHKGISGPVVMEASHYWDSKHEAAIDLMPDFNQTELDKLILKAFEESPNKFVGNIIEKFLPKRLVPMIVDFADKQANAVTKNERTQLITKIKAMPIKITGTAGFKEAVITAGGVDVQEINPSDMSSKKVSGLYFAGEVIDVDAATGGFNLQIAFSTGYQAGCSVGRREDYD